MGYRNYLQYDYGDFDPSSANSSNNIDLPTITKPHAQFFHQDEQYQASLIQENPQQYFDAIKLYPQNTFELNQIFWKIFLYIALIPLVNSALFNTITLTKNVFQLVELRSEYKKLTAEKADVLTKMKEYHSASGMKRTIKEEIKAIEQNEILVKIL